MTEAKEPYRIDDVKPIGDPFTYRAKVDPDSRYPNGAYDGDTIDLIVDVGFRMYSRQRIRLLGVDTPEIRGDEREEGLRFTNLTRDWLACTAINSKHKWPLLIRTEKADSFGRYLADVTRRDTGESLTAYLIENGSPVWKKGK